MFDSFFRTVVLYLLLIAVVRLLGKRQIGQMEPSEFVVTMLVANLASIPMEETESSLLQGVVPIVTVLALELLLAYLSLHSIRLRKLLCGKPVILIENGKLLRGNLRRNRITLDELSGHLREKDVLDIAAVQFAILETNGNLSVFPYPSEKPASARDAKIRPRKQYLPVTVVSDGQLIRENLQKARKTETWLQNVLRERNATLADTHLLTVDAGDTVRFYRKE